ncbi:MAG TPA: hypothetical protein VGK92_06665 [Gaiellales bacterium]
MPGGAAGASVILTDARRERFAQIGWITGAGGVPRSFAAWSTPHGSALRVLPGRLAPGGLIVYKAEVAGSVLRLWVDGVDGAPRLRGVPTELVAAEAQIEAATLGGARLGARAADPAVLGWTFAHVDGRWTRFAPASVSADAGLGARRTDTFDGEAGTHILVWDRGRSRPPVAVPARPPARVATTAELRAVFGVELHSATAARAAGAAVARRTARAATGASRVLGVQRAICDDRQLVPALHARCYVVAVAPGSRSPVGPRGGPARAAPTALTALVSADGERLLETLAL